MAKKVVHHVLKFQKKKKRVLLSMGDWRRNSKFRGEGGKKREGAGFWRTTVRFKISLSRCQKGKQVEFSYGKSSEGALRM